MTRKPIDTERARRVRELLAADPATIPAQLPTALAGQGQSKGESVFETALDSATADQVARARRITGPFDSEFCVETYRRTGNAVWLWLGISLASKPEEIPPEAFRYLTQAGTRFFIGAMSQVLALERVKITPGQELQEGIAHLPAGGPAPPDILEILGLSQPGRNPFQAVAREIQGWSAAIAVEDLVRRTGCSLDEAYAVLAMALGRTSPEAGPSTEAVRKIVRRGKRLLPRPGPK